MREVACESGALARVGAHGCRAWSAACYTRGIGSFAARPGAAPSRGTLGKPTTKFHKIYDFDGANFETELFLDVRRPQK
jgi:hypothetical protein